jgi:predicted TIM-barrel fold metal-dependent hydrolase
MNSHAEPIIEPDLPIIDAHHHLWLVEEPALAALEQDPSTYAQLCIPTFRRNARYLLEDYLADIKTGHNIRATVYIEAHAMYRASAEPAMKPVGEVEFANGTAAMAASGVFGDVKVCAGIIGKADLLLGDAVKPVLEAEMRAGGDRFRGVRTILMYDEDTNVLTHSFGNTPHVALDATFRAGFRHLAPLGLSFEAWMLEPQLPDLIDLARSFPETQIVVNHTGGPVGLGRFTGRLQERSPSGAKAFAPWRAAPMS